MGLDTDSLYTLLIEWPQAHCTSHMEMETDEHNLIEINYKCLTVYNQHPNMYNIIFSIYKPIKFWL